MKVHGFKKVETWMKAEYRQPFPTVEETIMVGDRKADLVISTGEGRYEIDGVMYSGETLIVLGRE